MKRDLQKRISTAIASAKRVDRYSAILIEQALIGMDTDLVALDSQPGISLAGLEEEAPKPRKKQAKLSCTPAPPNAVICNGEYYKKDNSMLSGDTVKAVSDKTLSDLPSSSEQESLGSARANEAL